MSLPITITAAGLAKLPSPDGTGTSAITITAIGVSATAITPDPSMTALPGELYRISSISGSHVSPDTIHVVMEDSSANAYSMTAFGLYLADGTLFGVYGQPTTILTKTAASIALLACDIVFAAAVASSITFGATTFNNPPASTTTMGVVQLATLAQAQAGVDAADVLTPATAIGAVVNWIAGKAVNLGTILRAGFQVWDAGNDGAGSGLDADLFHGHTPDQMIASYFSAGSNANGYWTKRPDGNGAALIEQWGSGGAIYSEGEITIAFPVPFTNLASIHVDAIAINASGAGTRDIWPQLATKTLTGATFMMQWDGISSTTPTLDGFQFAAKGY